MKKRYILYAMIVALVLSATLLFSQKKYALKTPEEGTRLRIPANFLLPAANNMLEGDPDAMYNRYKKQINAVFSPKVAKTIDTFAMNGRVEVPLRIYYPKGFKPGTPLPVLVFYHGGGFIYGSIGSYDMLVRKLTRKTGCIIVSVGYRLAEEAPFPAAVNDSYAVLKWVKENAANLGMDPSKLAVIGDSAGGNLATIMTLISDKKDDPDICCQVLLYPVTTMVDTSLPSRNYFMGQYGRHYVLSRDLMARIKEQYVADTSERLVYLSPLYASHHDGLPPALVITAQCDPLRDEGKLYAERMKASGMQVSYKDYKGMIHGFISLYPALKSGRKAIRQISDYLDKNLK